MEHFQDEFAALYESREKIGARGNDCIGALREETHSTMHLA